MKQINEPKKLKSGYTTGTCAAAAALAALEKLLHTRELQAAWIELPPGIWLKIPVNSYQELDHNRVRAEVIKNAGDDPDVTHGMSIYATVEILTGEAVIIEGGEGIGQVTKPGLAIPVGQAAINPVPLKMIRQAVKRIIPPGKGVRVVISAPQGEAVARKTFNPILGIKGGISILGTTGIVRPMSEEAYLSSLLPQISQAAALGQKVLVLTPGGMGARVAREKGFPEAAVVQTSNFIGKILEECARYDFEGIILFGHIGKMIKVAAGIFHTHSKVADGRRETLAAHAALLGAGQDIIREIMELNTMEASRELMAKYDLEPVYRSVALWASKRAREYMGRDMKLGTVLFALNGDILGFDDTALEIGRLQAWPIQLR